MPRIDIDALEEEWDDEPRRPGRRRGLADYSDEAQERIAAADVARVVGLDRGTVRIVMDGVEAVARYAGSMRGTKLVVGDDVRVRPARHETDVPRILERLDRRSVLLRTADDREDDTERIVVANVDRVAVVVAADNLESGFRFADRVLIAASAGGITPMVVVNRADLATDDDLEARVHDRFRHQELATVVTSATGGTGLATLAGLLAGGWTALNGHSGVGKSTLTNALISEAEQEVGELGTRGGRHTTVAARALRLPDGAGWLVDTPGVRSFGLAHVPVDELASHVPELAGLECDLDPCLHDGEPGCRVDEADAHPERLASYRRLLHALQEGDDTDVGRHASTWET